MIPASLAAAGSTRVSTITTGIPAALALAMAGTISFEPLGVMASAPTLVWIRFSMICICLSTSTSRSAACTTRVTPSRSASACAPRCISMKKGLFRVLSTRATVGFAVSPSFAAGGRLQATDTARPQHSRARIRDRM